MNPIRNNFICFILSYFLPASQLECGVGGDVISSPRRLSDKYLVVGEQAAVPVVGLRLRLSLDIYSICKWHDFSFPHSRYYNLSRRSLDEWFTCAVPDEDFRWRALQEQHSASPWHVFIRFRKSFPIIVRREVVLPSCSDVLW